MTIGGVTEFLGGPGKISEVIGVNRCLKCVFVLVGVNNCCVKEVMQVGYFGDFCQGV